MIQVTNIPRRRPDLTARQVAASRRFVADLQREPARTAPAASHPNDPLRGLAHAAFYEVVTPGDQALDAALDIYAAEIDRLQDRLAAQTEVLMLIRSYAQDCWLRNLACSALGPASADPRRLLPATLFDPEVAACAEREDAQ